MTQAKDEFFGGFGRESTGSPSCPLCGLVTHVEANHATSGRGRYYCGNCSTVFDGTDEEWRRMAPTRTQRQTNIAATAKLRAAREAANPEPAP